MSQKAIDKVTNQVLKARGDLIGLAAKAPQQRTDFKDFLEELMESFEPVFTAIVEVRKGWVPEPTSKSPAG